MKECGTEGRKMGIRESSQTAYTIFAMRTKNATKRGKKRGFIISLSDDVLEEAQNYFHYKQSYFWNFS